MITKRLLILLIALGLIISGVFLLLSSKKDQKGSVKNPDIVSNANKQTIETEHGRLIKPEENVVKPNSISGLVISVKADKITVKDENTQKSFVVTLTDDTFIGHIESDDAVDRINIEKGKSLEVYYPDGFDPDQAPEKDGAFTAESIMILK